MAVEVPSGFNTLIDSDDESATPAPPPLDEYSLGLTEDPRPATGTATGANAGGNAGSDDDDDDDEDDVLPSKKRIRSPSDSDADDVKGNRHDEGNDEDGVDGLEMDSDESDGDYARAKKAKAKKSKSGSGESEKDLARAEKKRAKKEARRREKEERKKKKKEKKAKKEKNRDSSGDDDEDGDDVSEDGEVSEDVEGDESNSEESDASNGNRRSKGKSKKKKKSGISRIFMSSVEVGDEESEGEDEYEKAEVEYEEHEAEAIEKVRQRQERLHAMHDRSATDVADEIVNRYKYTAAASLSASQYGQGQGVFRPGDIRQQTALPTTRDPPLFRVKVKIGQELVAVRSIMMKQFALKESGKRIGINSAFSTASKGFIYVEAVAEPLAREAIMNLRMIMQGSMQLVPIPQRTSLLQFSITGAKPLTKGQWVRMKRGPLKQDLVQVVEMLEGGTRAIIRAIPRPDYRGGGIGSSRPAQALFSPEEAEAAGGLVGRQKAFHATGEHMHTYKNEFYRMGFLIKEVVVSTYLTAVNVNPRLEELQLFREPVNEDDDLPDAFGDGEDEGDKANKSELGAKSVATTVAGMMRDLVDIAGSDPLLAADDVTAPLPFIVGDLVQVTAGELRNLIGRVVSLNESARTVDVKPIHANANLPVQRLEAVSLIKYIEQGQHVKVKQGKHIGQTGLVVSIILLDGAHVAVVLTDGVNTEISVNLDHLQVSNEVALALSELQGYELYDLVAVSPNENAVITVVGTEYLTVINNQGEVKRLLPQELKGKKNQQSSRSTTFDAAHATIQCGDTVTVTEGAFARKDGTVKHIMKSVLWLHSKNHMKNSGVFVIRSRSCQLAGYRSRVSFNGLQGGAPQPDVLGGRGRFGNTHSEHVGKTVRITRGSYKGVLANVKQADDHKFLLELYTKNKVVSLDRAYCTFETQTNPVEISYHGYVDTPHMGAETPMVTGSETPMVTGDQTPLQGAETPLGEHGGSSNPFNPNFNTNHNHGYGGGISSTAGSAYGSAIGDHYSAYGSGSVHSTGDYGGSHYSGSPGSTDSPYDGGGEADFFPDRASAVEYALWDRDSLLWHTRVSDYCVAQSPVDAYGMVTVSFGIKGDKNTSQHHHTDLYSVAVTKGASVVVLSGSIRGTFATVKTVVDNDCLLRGVEEVVAKNNLMVLVGR